MLSSLSPERRIVVAQLARFVVSGAFVTALGVIVYAVVALILRWHPQLGNFLAYVVAMAAGYVMHSRWSFRDHGSERTHATKIAFLRRFADQLRAQQLLGVAAVQPTPRWAGRRRSLPMLFVTPAVTFLLNRQWVFR